MTDTVTGRQVGIDWINQSPAGRDNRFKLYSQMAVLQSRWFGDRLITVFGLRRDQQDAWYSRTAVRNPPFGSFAVGDYEVKPGADNSPTSAQNKTAGLVYHVFRGFSLTYNYATNTALPNPVAAPPQRSWRPRTQSQRPEPGLWLQDRSRPAALPHGQLLRNLCPERFYQWHAGRAAGQLQPDLERARRRARRVTGGKSGRRLPDARQRHHRRFGLTRLRGRTRGEPHAELAALREFQRQHDEADNLGRDARTYLAKYRDFWLEGTNRRVLLDDSGRSRLWPTMAPP